MNSKYQLIHEFVEGNESLHCFCSQSDSLSLQDEYHVEMQALQYYTITSNAITFQKTPRV